MSTTKNEQHHILSPEWLRTNPLPEGDVFYRTKGYTHWCEFDRSFHRTDFMVAAQLNEYEFATQRTDLPPEAYITPPTDTTGSGREGETPETDAFSARLIPKNGRGEPLYMQALTEWRELSERLEAQRDAALAQVEALRRDGERLQWILDLIAEHGTDGLQSFPWSILDDPANDPDEDDPDRLTPILDRAAIDSAQRQEGR